jgi:hypothetical protein
MSDIEVRWLVVSGQEKKLQFRTRTTRVEYSSISQQQYKVYFWSEWEDVPTFFATDNII